MKEMKNLTATTHTARLAVAVMASGAVSALCRTLFWLSSMQKL
jgi:hypothetical protein